MLVSIVMCYLLPPASYRSYTCLATSEGRLYTSRVILPSRPYLDFILLIWNNNSPTHICLITKLQIMATIKILVHDNYILLSSGPDIIVPSTATLPSNPTYRRGPPSPPQKPPIRIADPSPSPSLSLAKFGSPFRHRLAIVSGLPGPGQRIPRSPTSMFIMPLRR